MQTIYAETLTMRVFTHALTHEHVRTYIPGILRPINPSDIEVYPVMCVRAVAFIYNVQLEVNRFNADV